jgi:hypothetical protein
VRCLFEAEKKNEINSDDGGSGSDKCEVGYDGAYGGLWWSLRFV